MVTKNSHKIYPFLFSYSSFSFLLPFLYQTTHHARVKHTLFSDRQHLYEQVFEKRVNLICYDEVEDDALEHRDGEGVADEDEVKDDALKHCNREVVVDKKELKDDVLKHYIEEVSVDGEDKVEDDTLKSNAKKFLEPLLMVCDLEKNREDEGDEKKKSKMKEKYYIL